MLNHWAAQKAMNMSAFDAVAHCVAQGIRISGEDCWDMDQYTTVELYTMRAEAEAHMENTKVTEIYYEQVISQKDHRLVEKLQYTRYIVKASQTGKSERSVPDWFVCASRLWCSFFQNQGRHFNSGSSQHLPFEKVRRDEIRQAFLKEVDKYTWNLLILLPRRPVAFGVLSKLGMDNQIRLQWFFRDCPCLNCFDMVWHFRRLPNGSRSGKDSS